MGASTVEPRVRHKTNFVHPKVEQGEYRTQLAHQVSFCFYAYLLVCFCNVRSCICYVLCAFQVKIRFYAQQHAYR